MTLMTKKIACLIFSLSFVFLFAREVFAVTLESRHKKAEGVLSGLEKENKELLDPRIGSSRFSLRYKSGDLRDPFLNQKAVVKKEGSTGKEKDVPLPVLNVQGLVWGGLFPQAIIDNKVYRVGDTIKIGDVVDGARITEISKEGIKVIFHSIEHTVPGPVLLGAKGSQNT